MPRKKARVSTSTAAAPRKSRKPRTAKTPRRAAPPARDAARRRELARIVRPLVRKYVEEALEDRFDLLAAERALAEGGEPIPAEEMFRKLGW